MPDERTYDIDPEIETLLGELTPDDLADTPLPADIWAGIEAQIAADRAPVVDLARRRSRFQPSQLLAIAAAVALVVVGAAVVMNRSGGQDSVLASADLAYDAEAFDPLGAGAAATARLVERDGGFVIELDDTTFPSVDDSADLELWLIEADDTGSIVDVAPVALIGGAGSYTVPDDLDVTTHRIVDISIEPRDGDDAHSGRSILRGTLADA